MTGPQTMPSAYDSEFWRLRARLQQRADGVPLAELALLEAGRSLDRASQWTAANQESSAAGERRRAQRLHLIAQFETHSTAERATILRLRAVELLRHGNADAATALRSEADEMLRLYLESLGAEALRIQNASNVLRFARASLAENPKGLHTGRLRKLIASARRTIAEAHSGKSIPAA